jgi:hypothetical protein
MVKISKMLILGQRLAILFDDEGDGPAMLLTVATVNSKQTYLKKSKFLLSAEDLAVAKKVHCRNGETIAEANQCFILKATVALKPLNRRWVYRAGETWKQRMYVDCVVSNKPLTFEFLSGRARAAS